MSGTDIPIQHGSYLMPSIEHATVADAMHPGVMTCDPAATPVEVARMMAAHHIHCMAVGIGREAAGESPAWGVISDLDLVRAGISTEELTAAAMASTPVITVEPGTPLREAARLMTSHRVRHLLVIEPGAQRPVGMVSTLDVVGVLAWGEA
jgi:CBS domain-containing protein